MKLNSSRWHNRWHERGSLTDVTPFSVQTNGLTKEFSKISWHRSETNFMFSSEMCLVCGYKIKMDCLIGQQPHFAIAPKDSGERKSSQWTLSDRVSGHPPCVEREVAYGMKINLTFLGSYVLPFLHTSGTIDWHEVQKTDFFALICD